MVKGKKHNRGSSGGPGKSKKETLTSAPKGESKGDSCTRGSRSSTFIQPRFLAGVCSIASLALYWNTHSNRWAYDDTIAILLNPDVQGATNIDAILYNDFWGQILANAGSNKSFRPLTVLSFRINAALSGMEPRSFHIVNNILNSIAVIMAVYTLAACKNGSRPWYLVASSFLFAFHPIHVEAVANTVGRAELIGALLAFGAFCCHQKSMTAEKAKRSSTSVYLLAAMVLGFASALAKEPCLMVLAVCGAHEIAAIWLPLTSKYTASSTYSKELPTSVLRFVLLALTGVAYICMRIQINGEGLGVKPQFKDNPLLFTDSKLAFALTALHIQATYAWKLIYPMKFCCDYGANVIPMIEKLADVRNLFTFAWMAGLGLLVSIGFQDARGEKRDPRVLLALAWIIGPLLPASHILALGTVLAERLLYMPSLGYGMLLGLGLERLDNSTSKKRTASAFPMIAIGLAIFSQSIIARNKDWYNDDSLFEADFKRHPENVKISTMYATRLITEGDYNQAIKISSKNYEDLPDDVGNIINLAKSIAMNGDFERGHEIIDEGVKIVEGREWPKWFDHKAYACKGYILGKQHNFDAAKVYYEKAFELAKRRAPDDLTPYCNMGEIEASLGNWAESVPFLEVCEQKYSHTPEDPMYINYLENLAKAAYMSNMFEKGEALCKRSLQFREDQTIRRILDDMIKRRMKKE